MKQCDKLYAEACRKAVKKGPRVVNYNGKDFVAYVMTKEELDSEIYTPAGYNTDKTDDSRGKGRAWLRQILRWRKMGAFTYPEFVVLDSNQDDWWVGFLNLTDNEVRRLEDFALEHHYAHILKG